MGINSTDVAYGFGQMGSAYLNDTGAYTPPTGKIIVGIQILDDLTKFTTLTPSNDTGSNSYFIGTSVTAAAIGNGVNAEAIGTSTTFKAGLTLVGRFSAVTLGAGSVIMYLAEA
jgi:hypothetical protein|tara:strand:+ start:27 stop:368 length:342 start_codon:yes stop_codon:yes gene_type:complete